jgi:anti-sigma B factor antagonist
MAAQANISVTDVLQTSMVRVSGHLDFRAVPELREVLRSLIDDGRLALLVDVSALEFCDLEGLEVLLEVRQDIERAGGALRLAGVHGNLKHMLDSGRLSHLFDIDETSVEALSELMSRS